jgi:hypothetical protein
MISAALVDLLCFATCSGLIAFLGAFGHSELAVRMSQVNSKSALSAVARCTGTIWHVGAEILSVKLQTQVNHCLLPEKRYRLKHNGKA